MTNNWLHDTGSLTQRFHRLTDYEICHQLIREGWNEATVAEQEKYYPQAVWLREITWHHRQNVLIYARTVIPEQTFKQSFNDRAIGQQALGNIMFASDDLSYSPFEFQDVDDQHPLYRATQQYLDNKPKRLKSRQREFIFKNNPLIVTEVFLPPFFKLFNES